MSTGQNLSLGKCWTSEIEKAGDSVAVNIA